MLNGKKKMPEDVCRGFDDDHVRWLGDAGWNAPTEAEKASISVGTVRLCLRKTCKKEAEKRKSLSRSDCTACGPEECRV